METKDKLIFQGDSLYLNSPKIISELKVREEEKENLLVYLAQDAYQWIENLLSLEPTKELVGVLLGQVYQGEDGNCIIIDEAMEAKYTEGGQSTPCFTHESWEDIYALKESKYPGKKIVGWFRTASGISLSTYDLMVQKGFFKNPWQVLYIIDSQANQRVFFRWKEKEVIPCPFFNLYLEKRALLQSDSSPQKEIRTKSRRKRRKNLARTIILRRIFALSLLLAIGGGVSYGLYSFFGSDWDYWSAFFEEEKIIEKVELLQGFVQTALDSLIKR